MATDRTARAIAIIAGILTLAACKKSAPVPPSAPVTCDQVGASFAQVLAADRAQAGTAEPDAAAVADAVVRAVIESCTKDAWTDAARACFLDEAAAASQKCQNEFTDAQVEALDDRMHSAVAKVAPADCSELEPVLREALATDVAEAPVAQRAELEARIEAFAPAIGALCATGWSVEARTCFRDATKARTDAGRCVRWLDEPQRKAYATTVESVFGPPPPDATR